MDRESEGKMYILIVFTVLVSLILFFICHTKLEKNENIYNEKVSPMIKKIGDNKEIAREILKYINNVSTEVEKNTDKNVKASFYNCNTDKIVIKDTEDLEDCSRVVHISHECVHSIQNKKILKCHFVISNIQILYFLGIFIYFFYNRNLELRFNLLIIQLFIFIATFFIKIVLESDATYRAVGVASGYLKDKIGNENAELFKKIVEEKIYKIVPMSYFGLYMQGVILLLIAQIGAVLI